METLRTFNRFELKYMVPVDKVPIIKDVLSSYMTPDKYGDDEWNYALSSLYYDTDTYRFYREKIDGIKYRRKLRIRCYETDKPLTMNSTVFVEIKQRIDRTTQKRRAPMRYEEALQLCNQWTLPENYDPKDEPVLNEIQQMVLWYWLKPICITSYFRQARQWADYDPWLRVTLDTNIRERHKDLELDSKQLWDYMIDPNMAIIEIKANDHIPHWIVDTIAENNFRLIRISKYCQWLEKAALVPQSRYHLV